MWELAAARTSGSVTSLVRVGNAVLAATPAGVRRSLDHGRTWAPIGPPRTPPVELLAAGGGRLWAGTADGLLCSDDAGASWRAVLVGSRVLAIAPTTDDLVLVGTEDDGVLRSEDGGRTWKSGNAGLQDLTVVGLATRGDVVYAATPTGVFRSRNSGRAWRALESFPVEYAPQCLALTERCVLVGTEQHGLQRSWDDATTWHAELPHRSVVSITCDQHRLLAATDAGIAASEHGATTSADDPTTSAENPTMSADDPSPSDATTSKDAATTTTWRLTPTSSPVLSAAFAADGTPLAGLVRQGVLRSTQTRQWLPSNDGLDANLVVALAASGERLYLAGLEDGIEVSSDLEGSSDAGATWSTTWNDGAAFNLSSDAAYAATSHGTLRRHAATSQGILQSHAVTSPAVVQPQAVPSQGTLQPREPTWQVIHASPSRAVSSFGRSVAALTLADELLLSDDAGATWQTLAPPESPTCLTFGPNGALLVGSATGIVRWNGHWQRVLDLPNTRAIALSPEGELLASGDELLIASHELLSARDELAHRARRTRLPGSVTAIATPPEFAAIATAARLAAVATTAGLWLFQGEHATLHLEGKPIVAVALMGSSYVYAAELGGRIWRHSLT